MAYTLTFGGLLLLGAQPGDILGRRRVFMTRILLFTFASLLGGLAQEPWQLLAARALQGVGGAIASPTSLALITTTFPEGPERNRAFGVFADGGVRLRHGSELCDCDRHRRLRGRPHEAGAASGLLNATQQVGGSLGLSILTTVFGTASKDEAKKQLPKFLAEGSPQQKAEFAKTHQLPAPWGHEVLAHGISTAFVPAVGMAGLALVTAGLVIKVRRSDLEALAGTAGPGLG